MSVSSQKNSEYHTDIMDYCHWLQKMQNNAKLCSCAWIFSRCNICFENLGKAGTDKL